MDNYMLSFAEARIGGLLFATAIVQAKTKWVLFIH